jgi:predicted double-glycine peptidase
MTMWRYHGYVWILILLSMGSVWAGERSGSSVRRHTLKELRDQYVVKQQLDYSCGAAALATLLTYYFGDETSERELLELLTAQLRRDELKRKEKQGFSLLDLKKVAQAKGYQAAGFKLTIEQLKQLAAPVLVFVEPQGYKHFAILRGVDRGRVFLADPARGNLRMSISRFLREWHGIIFVLGRSGEEELTTYPLALSRPVYIQPELLRVSRMTDFGAFVTGLAIRSR